jgi:hypothetical protein
MARTVKSNISRSEAMRLAAKLRKQGKDAKARKSGGKYIVVIS